MALSVRAKNFVVGGGLATFASAIFGYTFHQMGQVRASYTARSTAFSFFHYCAFSHVLSCSRHTIFPQDDFKDLDTVKVNVHQSGIKPSAIGKQDE